MLASYLTTQSMFSAPWRRRSRKTGSSGLWFCAHSEMPLSTTRTVCQHSSQAWAVLTSLGFWQSPSRFGTIQSALLSQISHASALPIDDELVPAVVELAAAVEGGPHHKEINSALLKHMRSDNARVRLAAVRCEISLTGRLGEDWLALLPEMLPFISELQEDDVRRAPLALHDLTVADVDDESVLQDEDVEKETQKWIVQIEGILGESIEAMLR